MMIAGIICLLCVGQMGFIAQNVIVPIGRVRFECIESVTSENLMNFIENNIEHGSAVITDGWSGYASLSDSEN